MRYILAILACCLWAEYANAQNPTAQCFNLTGLNNCVPWSGLALGSKIAGTVAIVDASGNQITTFGTANLSVGPTGSSVPTNATYVGGNVGGNLTGLSANTAGGINYLAVGVYDSTGTQLGGYTTGTFTTPSTATLSVVTLDPCSSATKKSVAINLTSATTTQLVALSGTTIVYACGFSVSIAPSATTADSLQFEYGTGSTCGTGTQTLTGTWGAGDLTTAAPPLSVNYGGGGQTLFAGIAGNALCAVSAGTTVNIQGVLTYVQQ